MRVKIRKRPLKNGYGKIYTEATIVIPANIARQIEDGQQFRVVRNRTGVLVFFPLDKDGNG